jgi:MSHA biogenesis protein MshJ
MNLETLRNWWKRRQPRERAMALFSAALLLAMGFDSLLLQPVRLKVAANRAQLAAARSQLDKLQHIVEERERVGSENLRSRQAELATRRAAAEAEIKRAQIELISPQDMERQLSAILRRFPELKVVGMATDAPSLLDETGNGEAKPAENAESRRSLLYRHGLELTIQGRFLDVISYLEQLEHAPYRIYWKELDLKVDPKGNPVTRIRFFTLSRGPEWLTL